MGDPSRCHPGWQLERRLKETAKLPHWEETSPPPPVGFGFVSPVASQAAASENSGDTWPVPGGTSLLSLEASALFFLSEENTAFPDSVFPDVCIHT